MLFGSNDLSFFSVACTAGLPGHRPFLHKSLHGIHSGVSAGIDMTLGFVTGKMGYKIVKQLSTEKEYDWIENPSWDPFAEIYA